MAQHSGMNQLWLAVVYMGIFAVMSFVILLQLVIAVLMDQFTQAGGEETESKCGEGSSPWHSLAMREREGREPGLWWLGGWRMCGGGHIIIAPGCDCGWAEPRARI